MNTSTYVFVFVVLFVGFICKTVFEYLLETDDRKYLDMAIEIMQAESEETDK